MKRTGNVRIIAMGMIFGLAGVISSCAQGTYQRPDYGQRQPDYDYSQGRNSDPGYDDYQYERSNQGVPRQGRPDAGRPDFYGQLSPYGQWVSTPEYGRIWIPNVGPTFQPYASDGRWVWTEYGNTWVSDYDWGWAPFHYGRWFRDPYRGWAWVPGYDWAPAWVNWRQGGGYYGWAPLGPNFNVNINVGNYWTFVPQQHFNSPRWRNYCAPRPQVVNIYNNTTIINNTYRYNNRSYAYGPRREEIETVTRQRVPVYRVENRTRPGRDEVGNGTIGVYRPDAGRPEISNGPRSGRGSSRVYNEPFDNRPTTAPGDYSRGRERTVPSEVLSTPNVPSTGTYERPSRGGRGRPSYEVPTQPQAGGGTYVQPSPQPSPQPSRTYPQPSPDESQRGGWSRRGGGGSYSPQQQQSLPQAREQRERNTESRGPSPLPPMTTPNTGRGSSRGPQ